MSSAEDILRNLAQLEVKTNSLVDEPLNSAAVTTQMLQVHATLALGGALLLVAEEIANLRVALTEREDGR